MLRLNDPVDLAGVGNPAIRALLARRFAQLAGDGAWDGAEHGYFLLVEAGDALADVEKEIPLPLLSGAEGEPPYGQAGWSPWWEWVAEHPACYEVAFVLNDDGYTVALFVPKGPGIPTDLLAACAEHAEAAEEVA